MGRYDDEVAERLRRANLQAMHGAAEGPPIPIPFPVFTTDPNPMVTLARNLFVQRRVTLGSTDSADVAELARGCPEDARTFQKELAEIAKKEQGQ